MEILQKMTDLPLEQCPACGQNTLKKLISAAAFHLKGTGWYKTDFSGKRQSPLSPSGVRGGKSETQEQLVD
jgi:putative FmdB family regulatory protein